MVGAYDVLDFSFHDGDSWNIPTTHTFTPYEVFLWRNLQQMQVISRIVEVQTEFFEHRSRISLHWGAVYPNQLHPPIII